MSKYENIDSLVKEYKSETNKLEDSDLYCSIDLDVNDFYRLLLDKKYEGHYKSCYTNIDVTIDKYSVILEHSRLFISKDTFLFINRLDFFFSTVNNTLTISLEDNNTHCLIGVIEFRKQE